MPSAPLPTAVTEEKVFAALPDSGFLRRYVRWACNRTDAHAAYHLAGALSILTQTIPAEMSVDSGKMNAHFYALIVGDSTTSRKTTAVTLAHKMLEAALPGRVGEQPGSAEGLVDGLRSSPRQLICYGEFGGFLSSAVQGHMSNVKTALTNIYDGQPVGRRTVKKQLGAILNPRLSVLAASTPDYLEEYTVPVDWTGGFLCRWLILAATREREYVETPPEDVQETQALQDYLKQLSSYSTVGVCLGKTPAASRLWREWVFKNRSIKVAREEVAAAIGRAEGFVYKICAILSWERHASYISAARWYIDEEEMRAAIAIVDLHLDSVMALAERISVNESQRQKRRVLRAIDPILGATQGDISAATGHLKRQTAELLATLLDEEKIVESRLPHRANATGYMLVSKEEVVPKLANHPGAIVLSFPQQSIAEVPTGPSNVSDLFAPGQNPSLSQNPSSPIIGEPTPGATPADKLFDPEPEPEPDAPSEAADLFS